MTVEEILKLFKEEFKDISNKFTFFNKSLENAKKNKEELINRAGVYVFWKDEKVIRVGRHLTNVRKRAFEHIRADTGYKMKDLATDTETRLILFTLDENDKHWAAALEIYFELNLKPSIPSKRLG